MKLLFVLNSPEYFRYLDGTFRALAAGGHQVLFAVNREHRADSSKQARIADLLDDSPGMEDLGKIPETHGACFRFSTGLRGLVDYLRFLHPDYRDTPALRNRIRDKELPKLFAWLDRVGTLPPALLRTTIQLLCRLDAALPANRGTVDFLRGQRPDLVAVIPLVTAASRQVEAIKAARALGIPTAACIASWDNLTNKGLVRIAPDRVFVWNDDQRDEAERYHYLDRQRVVATGAPVFDAWFERDASRDYAAFCREVGLDPALPYVLFLGSSSFISPNQDEIAFVRRWIAALRSSPCEDLRRAGILVRPHPYNYHAWEQTDVSLLGNVAIWPRRSPALAATENQRDFHDSLFHARAVAGINTSAMIEAAIVGRPVFTLSVPAFARGQEQTLHYRYLLREHGGIAEHAANLEDHVEQLGRVFAPAYQPPDFEGFIRRFVRPRGLSRRAGDLLADELLALAGGPAMTRQRPAGGAAATDKEQAPA